MKVILLEEIKGRGGEGDVIEVAQGFAVNYLFPKKLAIQATRGNIKQLEMRKHNIKKRETVRLEDAGKALEVLEGKRVVVRAKVGEDGQLFGSVTAPMVSVALLEQYNVEVDKKKIDIKKAIKTAGEHDASVSIYRDVKAQIKVLAVDESVTDEEVSALLAGAEPAAPDAEAPAVTDEAKIEEATVDGNAEEAAVLDATEDAEVATAEDATEDVEDASAVASAEDVAQEVSTEITEEAATEEA